MSTIDKIELSNTHEPILNVDYDELNYSSEDNSIYDNSSHKLIISLHLQEIFDKFIDQHKIELLSKYLSGVNTTIDHDFENNLHILKEHRLLVGGGGASSKQPPPSKSTPPLKKSPPADFDSGALDGWIFVDHPVD